MGIFAFYLLYVSLDMFNFAQIYNTNNKNNRNCQKCDY